MGLDPNSFDESTAENQDYDLTVLDITEAHSHINTFATDVQFKRLESFFDGIEDYEAKLSVRGVDFNSGDDQNELEGQRIVMLGIGQEHQKSITLNDGSSDVTGEHADSYAYLTPDDAEEVAEELMEFASRAREENQE